MRWLVAAVVGALVGAIATWLTKSQRRLVTYLIAGVVGGVAALILVDALSLNVHIGMTVISGIGADAVSACGGAFVIVVVWHQISKFLPG